ncbi:hypothetical protein IKF03_02420 [Candidatus Saccharibacteria bacterium]|nr:hypothetical protein [Candidatus Saccharibacteria bacterium]
MPEDNVNLKLIPEIVDKINDAKNILIALSSNPSVDEMSTAIGLSLFLDKLGKRATAIYSGSTPNALEFLKPEETFEPTIDALQDFVIALSKDKADHLRYKLDGDFVKIFITPYKTRISEEDLDYSYGDFNIDLVLALNVANGVDLDGALREHGRIMHDAVIVDITTGNPGKLGETEWSDKSASSVSEMVTKLIYSMEDKDKLGKEEATALLTGIVAATNRFSNAKTTAESMRMASRLMESGADQQLISKNITADMQNEIFNMMGDGKQKKSLKADTKDASQDTVAEDTVAKDTAQDIPEDSPENIPEDTPETASQSDDTPKDSAEDVLTVHQDDDPSLLEDLKAAEETLAQTGAETTPEPATSEATTPETTPEPTTPEATTSEATTPETTTPETPTPTEETPANLPQNGFISDRPEKVIQPTSSLDGSSPENKYEQMVEDALASVETPTAMPSVPMQPQPVSVPPMSNPAAASAPVVPTSPEINGVPQMNYMPMPSDQVLPPPPTPPIDMAPVPPVAPVAPGQAYAVPPVTAPVSMPASPAAPIAPASPNPTADPSAFQIPGM